MVGGGGGGLASAASRARTVAWTASIHAVARASLPCRAYSLICCVCSRRRTRSTAIACDFGLLRLFTPLLAMPHLPCVATRYPPGDLPFLNNVTIQPVLGDHFMARLKDQGLFRSCPAFAGRGDMVRGGALTAPTFDSLLGDTDVFSSPLTSIRKVAKQNPSRLVV